MAACASAARQTFLKSLPHALSACGRFGRFSQRALALFSSFAPACPKRRHRPLSSVLFLLVFRLPKGRQSVLTTWAARLTMLALESAWWIRFRPSPANGGMAEWFGFLSCGLRRLFGWLAGPRPVCFFFSSLGLNPLIRAFSSSRRVLLSRLKACARRLSGTCLAISDLKWLK